MPKYGQEIGAEIWARNRCRNMGNKTVPKYGAQIGTEILWGWRQKTAPKSVPTSSGAGVRKRHRNRCRHHLELASETVFKSVPKSHGAGFRKWHSKRIPILMEMVAESEYVHTACAVRGCACVCVCVCVRAWGGATGAGRVAARGGGMCACREDALTN